MTKNRSIWEVRFRALRQEILSEIERVKIVDIADKYLSDDIVEVEEARVKIKVLQDLNERAKSIQETPEYRFIYYQE